MGDRLYNPTTGRFTSPDPEPGGNTTAYTYPLDPINSYDIDGHWGWGWARNAWSVARLGRNALPTAGAYLWAGAHHGKCSWRSGLMLACGGMRGGYARGGTTIGNTWLYGNLYSRKRLRHETKHADQFAIFGARRFAVMYVLESWRTRRHPKRNIFERWAGLIDGGY